MLSSWGVNGPGRLGYYSKCEVEVIVIKLDIGLLAREAIVLHYLLICRCVAIIKIRPKTKTEVSI